MTTYWEFQHGSQTIFVPEIEPATEQQDSVNHILITSDGRVEILASYERKVIPDCVRLAKLSIGSRERV